MIKLKPCPFCGGEAKLSTFSEKPYYDIECQTCPCEMEFMESEEEAINAWNRRINDARD